jgi:hypothetical protein
MTVVQSSVTSRRPGEEMIGKFPLSLNGWQRLRQNVYSIIFSLSAALALVTASECHSITHLPSLLYGATLWGWWGMLASILWMLSRRHPSITALSPRTAVAHLFLGPLVSASHLLLLWSIAFTVPMAQRAGVLRSEWVRLVETNRFGIEILIYGFIIGAIGAVQFHIRSQNEAIRSSDLRRQLAAAQLQALQMQLEPHFLFNTLNAITTLVELERTSEATRMLGHLNIILKSTLVSSTPQKVPLSRELEIIDNYLAIEQVRFADRLKVDMKIDQGALDGLVPNFLLQPIVENAIRHGIAHCEDHGRIEASFRREGQMLRLNVRDSGPGLLAPAGKGNGIGLRNTRERLRHFYEDRFEMNAEATKMGGFEVAISIPYEQ